MTDPATLRKSATAARRAGRIAWAADMDEAADRIEALVFEAAELRAERAEAVKSVAAEWKADSMSLLGLIADIRKAAGDPTGKLMQDELIERIMSQRMMAECMAECRADLIRASVIDKDVPPMMLADAVIGVVGELRKRGEWQDIATAPQCRDILVCGGVFWRESDSTNLPLVGTTTAWWDVFQDAWCVGEMDGAQLFAKPARWQPLPPPETSNG